MDTNRTYRTFRTAAIACLFFLLTVHPCRAQLDTLLRIDSILVRAPAPSWSQTILSEQQLTQRDSKSLGELLSSVPGIQDSYHGPHAGAPMIRSLSGNRVRVLRNNNSISDLSGISPNFGISIDADHIEQVHIFKSEASVLYGGRAIGGAINIIDQTVPKNVPDRTVTGSAKASWHSNAGQQASLALNGKANTHSLWHVDASWRRNGDLRIPGHPKIDWAYSPSIDDLQAAMAQVFVDKESRQNTSLYPYLSRFVLEHIDDPSQGLHEADMYTFSPQSVIGGYEVPNPPNPDYIAGQDPSTPLYTTVVHGIYDYAPVRRGYIPNSHADHRSVNLGYAWRTSRLHLGIGYRGSEGFFGIPGFARLRQPSHSHSHGDGHNHQEEDLGYSPINTRSRSNGVVGEATLEVGLPWLSTIKNSYSLQLSDDRELVGIYKMNEFRSTLHSNRLEIHQSPYAFWQGVSGLDILDRKIVGAGTMRYIPHTRSREHSAFTQQQFTIGTLRASAGYRIERVQRQAMPDADYKRSRGLSGGNLSSRRFWLQQFNTELSWTICSFLRVMGSYQHAERAPEVNELYAGNDHFAIMIEENGDDKLSKETNDGFELGIEVVQVRGWHLKSTYYHNTFKNYLYLAHTGISRSGGFLVKEWRGADTEVSGWEVELEKHHEFSNGFVLQSRGYFDLVKNRNTSTDPMRQWAEGDFMPNMPTSRLGLSTELQAGEWGMYIAADSYLKQKLLGKNINPEPPMPGFSVIHAKIARRFFWHRCSLTAYLQGNNLLNTEARLQQSALKYLSPLPGRNISIGIQLAI